ncbi:MAG TPA: Bug family tripartite tricarboxylate transporter substrate binding protein [Burkholderiaceae bacterium]|nr:Bug family tripartite tricarboxylate transporter substrate binding protein [Burkholderiaceae bacterium]
MDQSRRRLLAGAAAAAGAAWLPTTAWSQAQIDTARLIVGFPPGGTTDVIGRRLGEHLRGAYARVTVVENRAGAGGRLAIDHVKNAAPDGTTVLVSPCSMMTIYPHIYKKLTYNPFEDLTPVSSICSTVFGLAIGPAVPESVRDLRQFLAWCKENPKQSNYGSPAAGSTAHFLPAQLERIAGIEFRHVPFRGSQPAIHDLLGGQVSSVSAPIGEFLPHMKTGRIRMLAASGTQRSKYYPDVPTYIELGFRNLEAREPYAVFLPAKAPSELVQRLASAVRTAVAAPEFVEGIAQMGLDAGVMTPPELAQWLRADHDRWGPIVKEIGFTADS